MADINHIITQGIGEPADITHFVLLGLSVEPSPTLDKWEPRVSQPQRQKPRLIGNDGATMTATPPFRPEPSLEMWAFHQPDFARKHPPRPHGGLFTAYPIRPEPSLEMWEFKPPDFAKAHPPRPHGGMFAGTPVRPEPIVSDWMFYQPDFAGRARLPLVRTGLYTTDTFTPPDPAPELSWHPQYPDLHTYRWRLSRAWYHPALQGPFTVTDLVHVDFIHGHWSMSPAVLAKFTMRPIVAGSGGINP